MNCGLGNLFDLKRELLLSSDASGTDFDSAVQELGLGVASLMEGYCNRRFARMENDQHAFDPYTAFITLRRYPIESIASVELRSSTAQGFLVQSGQPENFRRESGLVLFGGILGGLTETGRITWTGGYFFSTLEPTDDGYPEALPEGAEQLPHALKLAWLKQCKYYWDRSSIENRAKAGFTDKEAARFVQIEDDLLETTKRMLDPFRRLA